MLCSFWFGPTIYTDCDARGREKRKEFIGQRRENSLRIKGKEMIGEKGAKKGRREEAEASKRRTEGKAYRQSGLDNRLGARGGMGSWARMLSSSNIGVVVLKRRNQMLDADTLKATKTKGQGACPRPTSRTIVALAMTSPTYEKRPEKY
jgi:hypothetical protein